MIAACAAWSCASRTSSAAGSSSRLPAERFTSGLLTAGQGFDGSSLRGFQEIQDSDMLLMPDIETAVYDPMSSSQVPTLAVICDVADPITRSTYSRDPRHIAQKAEEYLSLDRHRRHGLLRPGERVLHLRRRPLRAVAGHRLLPPRLGGGALEQRPRRGSRTSPTRSRARRATRRSLPSTPSPTFAGRCTRRWRRSG